MVKKLAVGASAHKIGVNRKGAVYLYTVDWSNGNTVEKLKIADDLQGVFLANNDNFGFGVSLSNDGTMLAVGAIADDTGGRDRGAVYLYTVTWGNSSATILQMTKITTNDITGGLKNIDNFGSAVSLSAYGTKLAVGAHGDDSGKDGAGAAYLINLPHATGYQSQLKGGTNVTIVASNGYYYR